jgi:hypothetical protein
MVKIEITNLIIIIKWMRVKIRKEEERERQSSNNKKRK